MTKGRNAETAETAEQGGECGLAATKRRKAMEAGGQTNDESKSRRITQALPS